MTLLYQNFSNWTPGQPANPLTERCMEMKMEFDPKLMVFNDFDCAQTRLFICEGDQSECSPTCPSKSTCVKQNDNFNSKGQLLNAFSYGRWATGTDKTYLYGTKYALTWTAAYNTCCSIGMELLSVASDQEMQNVFNLNNNNNLLKYNLDFWTSGTQLGCNFRYNYCSTGTMFSWDDLKWNTNQPDNTNEQQWCVNSHFGPAASYSLSAAYLDDVPCTNSHNFICQMPATPCNSVPCFDYNCTVDPTKSAQVTAMSGPDGQFGTFCGRKYFYHKDSKTSKDAYYECCKFGMKLVSVETDAERVCIHNGFMTAGWTAGSVWTSGTDNGIGCVGKFGWCPDGTFLGSDAKWGATQPDLPYVESCVHLNIVGGDGSATHFNNYPCDIASRFLCEQPV
ncbi:uncharacterized protein LOC135942902 [Cloeon dipterum]|uniref:uncharacterized protein LOC135942902 n=1 Tax=Cloeon dipterum TaxID=197152 RepID=UPI00321FFB3A